MRREERFFSLRTSASPCLRVEMTGFSQRSLPFALRRTRSAMKTNLFSEEQSMNDVRYIALSLIHI